MCGGDLATFERVKDARRRLRQGAGTHRRCRCRSVTKMVNQICIAGLVQALSEGLCICAEGRRRPEAGARRHQQGAAQSWQMENRGNTMVDGRIRLLASRWTGCGAIWHLPEEARRNGARLPVTALVDQFTPTCNKWVVAGWTRQARSSAPGLT